MKLIKTLLLLCIFSTSLENKAYRDIYKPNKDAFSDKSLIEKQEHFSKIIDGFLPKIKQGHIWDEPVKQLEFAIQFLINHIDVVPSKQDLYSMGPWREMGTEYWVKREYKRKNRKEMKNYTPPLDKRTINWDYPHPAHINFYETLRYLVDLCNSRRKIKQN